MTVRMTGLTGLLDTDALVSASMEPYKLKYTTQQQSEQKLEWKQEEYREIMKASNSFYSKYLTSDGSSTLIMSTAYNVVKYTSSNENAVSATTTTGASIDNYKVSVKQLASAATTTLGSGTYGSSFTIKDTNGNQVDIDPSSISGWGTMTDDDKGIAVASLINSKLGSDSGMKANYSKFSGGIVLQSNDLGDNVKFSVNGTEYAGKDLQATITNASGKSYSLSDLNTNTATIDNITFTFKDVTSTTSTSTKYITSASMTNVLGDHIKSVTTDASGKTYYTLDDTNSTKITMNSDGSIQNLASPLTLTNKDGSKTTVNTDNTVTSETIDNNQVTLSGSKDVSKLKDTIKSFVNDYNALMTQINSRIYETYDKDYQPLTEDQKKDMSEDQITKWETKAKAGLLHNDNYLEDLAQGMKDAMSGIIGNSLISSSGLTLENIGIKPVKDYTTLNGTYEIDDEKLTNALENNLDAVQDMFTKDTTSSDKSKSGLIPKLGSLLYNQVKKVDSTFDSLAGTENGKNALTNELSKQISDMKKKLTQMNDDLQDREDTLYSKYAKLESSLSQLQSQQSSLASYFSSES